RSRHAPAQSAQPNTRRRSPMGLPKIYTQPVDQLENFEMSGDDLTVVTNCTKHTENDSSAVSAKKHAEAATNTATTSKEHTMSSTPIISDPALTVHRDFCEPTKCRADRTGVDNTGKLEAIVHYGPEYGFITEPDTPYSPAGRLTVQLEEFNN